MLALLAIVFADVVDCQTNASMPVMPPVLDGKWIGSNTLIGIYNASINGSTIIVNAPKFNFTADRSFMIDTTTTPWNVVIFDTTCLRKLRCRICRRSRAGVVEGSCDLASLVMYNTSVNLHALFKYAGSPAQMNEYLTLAIDIDNCDSVLPTSFSMVPGVLVLIIRKLCNSRLCISEKCNASSVARCKRTSHAGAADHYGTAVRKCDKWSRLSGCLFDDRCRPERAALRLRAGPHRTRVSTCVRRDVVVLRAITNRCSVHK
jgi:hypothetical protein